MFRSLSESCFVGVGKFKFRSQLDECSCINLFQIDLTEIEKPEFCLMLVVTWRLGKKEVTGSTSGILHIPSILLYFWIVRLALELVVSGSSFFSCSLPPPFPFSNISFFPLCGSFKTKMT